MPSVEIDPQSLQSSDHRPTPSQGHRDRPTCVLQYILLLQSALHPLWGLACSTIVEYSQQEGFYRVPLPAARQTSQLGGPLQYITVTKCTLYCLIKGDC